MLRNSILMSLYGPRPKTIYPIVRLKMPMILENSYAALSTELKGPNDYCGLASRHLSYLGDFDNVPLLI